MDYESAALAALDPMTSGLPVVVKGVVRGDDARRAVDHGASAIVVSNHGGLRCSRCWPPSWTRPWGSAAART